MSFLPITCDNCGAKYKLPESFSGSQAKCQKCGSVIDVAKQRGGSGAAPAAAKPAAARPAAARPAAARPAAERASAATPAATRSARGKKADGGDDKPARGKRGGGEAKKSSMMPALLGIGGLAVIGVVAFLMFGNKEPDKTNDAATPAAQQPAAKPAEKPAEQPAAKPAEKPVEKPAEKPAEQPAAKPAEQPVDPTPAEDTDPNAPKRPWQKMRNAPQTMDQVTDPKSYPEVPWPASVDDAKKAEIRALVEEVPGGGVTGIRAKKKLVEMDYVAMFGIVEKLRMLNYRDSYDSGVAFEFNKALEEITFELNARFDPVEATEDIVPAKAEWNTRTVKAWIDLMNKFLDEEEFKKGRAERKKKAAGEMK